MKVLIAIDSFKNCISSKEAAMAIVKGLPDEKCVVMPVSDGGEGFSSILTEALGGKTVSVQVHDPLGRIINAEYGLCGNVAIIESAAASGLALMSPDEYNPMAASSHGTGEMIADAIRNGAECIYLGLGGTGTNDGGKGLIDALEGIDTSRCSFVGLCDVSNIFCGPEGASAVFGPQKGATKEMVPILDERLKSLAEDYLLKSGRDVLCKAGSGAAGGIGGAIWAMLGAELKPGAEVVLDILGFDEKIEGARLVITGEGHLDSQSLKGKLPYTVATRAHKHKVKVAALVGRNELRPSDSVFDYIIGITPEGTPLEIALDKDFAAARLEESAAQLIKTIRQ